MPTSHQHVEDKAPRIVTSKTEREDLLRGFFAQEELSAAAYLRKHGRGPSLFTQFAAAAFTTNGFKTIEEKVRNGEWTVEQVLRKIEKQRKNNGSHKGVIVEHEEVPPAPKQTQLNLTISSPPPQARTAGNSTPTMAQAHAMELMGRALATLERFEERVADNIIAAEALMGDLRSEQLRVKIARKTMEEAMEVTLSAFPGYKPEKH